MMRTPLFHVAVAMLVGGSMVAACAAAPPAPGTQPTTKPVKEFRTAGEVLQLIPGQLIPRQGKWTELKREEANKGLEEAVDQTGHFSFRVTQSDRTPDGAYKGTIRIGGHLATLKGIDFAAWAYFNDDQAAKVAKINVNDSVTVTGTIKRCELQADGTVIVDLFQANLAK
jgi:hypothetical protein